MQTCAVGHIGQTDVGSLGDACTNMGSACTSMVIVQVPNVQLGTAIWHLRKARGVLNKAGASYKAAFRQNNVC